MMAMAYPGNEVSGYAACAACARHFHEILLLVSDQGRQAASSALHMSSIQQVSHRQRVAVEVGRGRPSI